MYSLTYQFLLGLQQVKARIPQTVLCIANSCFMDYLGVTIGGIQYLREKHTPMISSASSPVFSNGFAAHVLELDDGHRHGMIHLGASIITAILIVAEKEKLSSESMLKGIVMGYETAVRCARAI